ISSPAVILGFVYAPIVLFVKALKTRQIDNKTIMIDQVVVMCMNALLKK
ncbi:TetR family transcriptional regulator, partial [Lactiplantibacillus plantarum]